MGTLDGLIERAGQGVKLRYNIQWIDMGIKGDVR